MRGRRFLLLLAAVVLLIAAADAPPEVHRGWIGSYFRWGVILQVVAIIHFARRRPENYWLWIIYILAEVLPDFFLVSAAMKGVSRRNRIRMLEAIVLENPSAGNYEELGELLLEEKRYARARECFDAALSSRSDHIDPFYRRGVCAYHLGDYAEAIADLERTVTVDPKYDYARAPKYLAQSLAKAGRIDEASAAFDRLLAVTSTSEALIAAADFFAENGRANDARELVTRILARRATMPRYQKRRERAWLRRASALRRKLALA
ncbi:MAG: hypothetical protein QOI24_457 [Acidobacteriota bacterium]|jgi:tetratricopeptide (TPR) repeat protein|nr:hypothetical protein [Acidobacteriota bacterium]